MARADRSSVRRARVEGWRAVAIEGGLPALAAACDAVRRSRGMPDEVFEALCDAMAAAAARGTSPPRRTRSCERCLELAAEGVAGTWRRSGSGGWHLHVTQVPECEQPAAARVRGPALGAPGVPDT